MKRMSRVFYETWNVKFKNISRKNPEKLIISRIFQEPLLIQEQFKESKNCWPHWVIHDDKYLTTKVYSFANEIKTNFHNNGLPPKNAMVNI